MRETTDRLCDLSDAVVLIGSMLSSDERSSVPAGQTVSAALVGGIVRPVFEKTPPDLGLTRGDALRIERLARNTPFEVLLQDHPEPDHVRSVLTSICRRAAPNPMHEALAEAIAAGQVSHIVTTNYDTCIESALSSLPQRQVIVEEGEAASANFSDPTTMPIVFKIHGCASRANTMVFRLSEEGALPSWKRSLLARMVDGRDLVVMGYSGLDFDICPVLFRLNYRRLIWVFAAKSGLDEAIEWSSPNVRSVHAAQHIFDRVFGRMGGFDGIFEGFPSLKGYQFKPSRQPSDIATKLFAGEALKPFEYSLWRGRLLHAISCRLGSEIVYRALTPIDKERPEALRLWSDTLERAGRYADSIAVLGRLERSFAADNRYDDVLEVMFVGTGRAHTALRPFAFRQAWARYRRMVHWCTVSGVSFDKLLAQARDVYLFALALKQIRMIPLVGRALARFQAKRLPSNAFEIAAQLHYERGEWQEVRLIRTTCQQVGITVDIRDGSGSFHEADFLLQSVEAFVHANNIVGQASAYRRQEIKASSRCEELLEALAAFGHSAEFWKAYLSFAPHISDRRRRMYRGFALSEMKRCQYSLPVKFMYRMVSIAKLFTFWLK